MAASSPVVFQQQRAFTDILYGGPDGNRTRYKTPFTPLESTFTAAEI